MIYLLLKNKKINTYINKKMMLRQQNKWFQKNRFQGSKDTVILLSIITKKKLNLQNTKTQIN